MWQTIKDIWDKATTGQRTIIIAILPILACFYLTITNIDFTAISVTKNNALHQLHEKNAIDSVKHIYEDSLKSMRHNFFQRFILMKKENDSLKKHIQILEGSNIGG